MGFVLHNGYRTRFVDELYVTIQRRGLLSINRAAYEALGRPAFVGLQFDEDEKLIGICKAPQDASYAIPVRKQGPSDSYLIAATSFLRKNKIDATVSMQYKAAMQKKDLVADLKEMGIDVTNSRRPRIREKAETSGSDQNEQLSAFQQLPLETDPLCNGKATQGKQLPPFQDVHDALLLNLKQQSTEERKTNLEKLLLELVSTLKEI